MTERVKRFLRRWGPHLGVALICLLIFKLARSMQEEGHGWGDDFALYIDQARGLTDGSVGEVVALTRYALDNSAYHTFSADVYPWVFPMLLAPVVAWKGIDYSALKFVVTLCFVAALFVMQRVFRHRIGEIGALVIMLAVGLNNIYLGYTDAVLTDMTFMLAVFVALWWMDRVIVRGRLFGAAWQPLFGMGVLAAVAFNTRREGVALLFGIAAAQAAHWAAGRDLWRRTKAAGGRPWKRLALTAATPYIGFAVVAAAFQLILPGQPYQRFADAGGSGRHNMVFNLKWYKLPLAELLGLKDVGPHPITLLGSESLGTAVFWILLGAVIGGIVWRLVVAAKVDAHLAGTLIALALLILAPPFRENRYLFSLLPLMLYFAWQGFDALQQGVVFVVARRRVRTPAVLASLVLALPMIAVATDTRLAYRYHRDYSYVEWGPAYPTAQEAFDAVLQYTDPSDVIVFYQARTMNLYTRRKAVQGNSESMMLQQGDWYLMAKNSDYIQTKLTDARAAELGFVKYWENANFVLWRIPPRYPTLPASGGIPPPVTTSEPPG